MGGGHVTRPDFDLPRANPDDPMTEFYLALQKALNRTPEFALPGAYVAFRPPMGEKLYAEDIRGYCTFFGAPRDDCRTIFAPGMLHLLNDELMTQPDGTPSALVLTDTAHRSTAVRLLPPYANAALPPMPACTAALTLQLTDEDVFLIDSDPAALGVRLAESVAHKCWLSHPKIDAWLMTALAAAQRAYRKEASDLQKWHGIENY